MANQDHLNILRQGVKAWNEWRKANPDIRPDLSGANLSGMNLNFANFSGANLSRTDLSRSNLTDSILFSADLRRANLEYTKLERANLAGADLMGTYLNGAYLSEANLTGAKLAGANLRDSDFTNANLKSATLHDVALSNPTITKEMRQKARFIDIIDIDEPEEIAEQMELTASPGNPPPGNADMVSEGTEISGSHIGPAPAAVRPVAPDDQEANQQAALDALRQLQTDLSPMVGYDQETRPGSNAPELPLSQDQLDLLRGFVAAEIALLGAPIMDDDTRNIIQKITMKLREIEELLKAANAVNKQASKLLITLGLTIAAILRFIH